MDDHELGLLVSQTWLTTRQTSDLWAFFVGECPFPIDLGASKETFRRRCREEKLDQLGVRVERSDDEYRIHVGDLLAMLRGVTGGISASVVRAEAFRRELRE
jgi:hypothetical protein